jgi:predicted DCC family thiol-disulfide oxidoreductase YuxK
VQFIIKHDRKKKFRFATLQGKTGQAILTGAGLAQNDFNSFILVDGDKVYSHSGAALRMCKKLGGGWSLLYGLMIVPRFIRDAVYNLIARNRYKWFGKRESCMLPTTELKERFLE